MKEDKKSCSNNFSDDILKELKISQLLELYKRQNKELDNFK